jgi:diacylglycerol kinase (ATP)
MTSHLKTCVILNPKAGSAALAEDAIEKLRRFSPNEFHITSESGSAVKIAQKVVEKGCDFIVAAGGDGTLNEVINGIGERVGQCRVGLVPLGTGNDFARSLGLPTDPHECIALLRSRNFKSVDLVRVTSDQIRYFLNVSAGGFSGLVDEKLTPEIKNTWGPLAYLRGAAAALPELQGYQTTIVLDETETIALELYKVVIANGRYVAGGIPIAPEAILDDGLLDVILIPKTSATDLTMVVAQIVLGKHMGTNGIVFRRAAKVAVNSKPGMWFNVDGEPVGNEPAVFEVLPRALPFVTAEP